MKINVEVDIESVVAKFMEEYCEEGYSEEIGGYLENNTPDDALSDAIFSQVVEKIQNKMETKIDFHVTDGHKEKIQEEFNSKLNKELHYRIENMLNDFFKEKTITIEEGPNWDRKTKEITYHELIVQKIESQLKETNWPSGYSKYNLVDYIIKEKMETEVVEVVNKIISESRKEQKND